ncbi:hypothetical protein FQN54_002048 [Arachnomyces sp. PD_36]|nr:hypothetical protein FQN54_002048 [Arachnomyces sp. PD_36]
MSASGPHGQGGGDGSSSSGQLPQQDRLQVPAEASQASGQAQYGISETLRNRFRSSSVGRMSAPSNIPNAKPINQRTPARSFYHRAFHGSLGDNVQYSSQGVREETAALASRAISDTGSVLSDGSLDQLDDIQSFSTGGGYRPEPIEEATEPHTPVEPSAPIRPSSSSALTEMIRNSPPDEDEGADGHGPKPKTSSEPTIHVTDSAGSADDERTSLLRKRSVSKEPRNYRTVEDIEGQDFLRKRHPHKLRQALAKGQAIGRRITDPKSWDRRTIWRDGVVYPVSLLPAVLLGLLLNILDALSYGMILFPLGNAVFADLGADGISIFYVSTIVAQLVFSLGGSIFKGGVGSEMIEVVPFFHKMAFMVLNKVGADDPKSVIATTILSYAISSVLTGTVFFLMGACKLGSLIGFFPRHILIGCIGGVGWFLVVTGVEVSARLPGNLEYDLTTLRQLLQLDTLFLWTIPLFLAIGLIVLKRWVKSNFLVGTYFLSVGAFFYIVKFAAGVPLDTLRGGGWVFEAPSASNPWYHFYTLYDFTAVNWSALADTIPAMFALTFFGILHVPINVPALSISTGEDNLDVDRELIAHGVSNVLSGFCGSIQNYLVYTNSLLFIDSGGTSRLAGIMLAIATAGILFIGPVIIGYIPIMVVGALIFLLGIELLEEALVDTWGRLHKLEYLTIFIIVVTMGAWDFVIGIFVGIILACVNFVVQTSRKSAIRATYSGQIAGSTVRRHPIQVKFLKEAGKQTLVIKLSGFLFFGSIVSVEKTIRGLIEEEAFSKRPIRFLVLDLAHVNGLDFSAAEAFTRVNRILRKRNVQMIISELDIDGDVGKSLRNVGLFREENHVEIFETLNSALEYCENDLLKILYSRKEALAEENRPVTAYLNVPDHHHPTTPLLQDQPINSPRRTYLNQIATTTLREEAASASASTNPTSTTSPLPSLYTTFSQPLPLILQTFHGLTTRPPDFWFPACPYFTRRHLPRSTVLYHTNDPPSTQSFYLLETGMLRAEYNLPQGRYSEVIVPGRPCGELPFFGETRRTATVWAEEESVVWCLGREEWEGLKRGEPEVGLEVLRVCLKLTSERVESVTSYVLMAAG